MPNLLPQQHTFLPPAEQPPISWLPLRERPVSRIAYSGPFACSITELLAALVGGPNQLHIATALLVKYRTLARIASASIRDLCAVKGIGETIAARLKAALELGRRNLVETPFDRPQIRSPADAANIVMSQLRDLEQEHLMLLVLDTKNHVIDDPTVYIGNLNSSIIRIGEVCRAMLKSNAAGVIIVHNHPSGDPSPSPEDIRVTERLVDAAQMLDIDVMDHIIIGHDRFVSLKERGLGFK